MALTRPTFNNLNTATSQAYFNDTMLTINYGNVTANNQDIGFVLNRGSSGNVALVWSEITKGFVLAHTTSSGLTASNISVTANANLRLGNLEVSGVTSLGSAATGTDLTLSGNLTVNGTTVTINATTLTTNDKNIVVANNQSTSSSIDGAGIDAGGGTPIATLRYNHATTSWQSNVSVLPAATNTLTLGGTSNYWNNIYATTHTGTTGTFTGTITAATINAATIGNSGAALTGTLQTAAQTNITSVGTLTGLTLSGTLTGTTLNAATIGNSGALITGTLQTAAQTNITSVGTLGSLSVTGNVSGGNLTTTGTITASGRVYGLELSSTQSSGDEGGQINLALAATNTTLSGNVVVDVYQNKLRIFEGGGTNRGAYIDLTQANASVGTNLLAGSGGGTPGGSDTYVQFNDGGIFGGNSQLTFSKTTGYFKAPIIESTNNGNGTNFKVGDDAWIGDINVTNTIRIKGQQASTQGYIVFGDSDATNYIGRDGTGPIKVAGAFSVLGTLTGTTINAATIGNSGAALTGTLSSGTQNNITSATGITTMGNVTSGTWSATLGAVSAANLTNIPAAQLSGTIPSAVLGNSTHYIGTTAVTLNRGSASLSLTGVNIDGSAGTLGGLTKSQLWNNSGQNHSAYSSFATPTDFGEWFIHQDTFSDGPSAINVGGGNTGQYYSRSVGLGNDYAYTSYGMQQAIGRNVTQPYHWIRSREGGSWGSWTKMAAGYADSAATATNQSGGTVAATTGSFSGQITSTLATGTAPLAVASTTVVTNLNADLWDGNHFSSYLNQAVLSSSSPTFAAITVPNIVHSGTTGVGNIGASGAGFNTVFAKATSAQYADLAENYVADLVYEPGTVVVFGGSQEITVTEKDHDSRVAGVISTNPAYLMNSESDGLPVAFTGRVPCKVQGPVKKGDVLVTSGMPGVAQTIDNEKFVPGCVIGKALEEYKDFNVTTIEVVVGRF